MRLVATLKMFEETIYETYYYDKYIDEIIFNNPSLKTQQTLLKIMN